MKNGMKCLVILTLWSLVCFGFAQERQGGDQGGGQGRGRGGFGQGMMRGGFGQGAGSSLMLLRRTDVQEDLKLTDDQKAKLLEIQQSMRSRFTGGAGSGEQADRQAMRKQREEAMAEIAKSVDAVLTPEQRQRLKEIAIQLMGNRWVLNKENAKTLGITVEQQQKLDGLQESLRMANQGVQERQRSGEIERDVARGIMEKNNDHLNVEIAKVLTDAQKAKLKELGGRHFEAKPQERGGRRGGGGTRRGGIG